MRFCKRAMPSAMQLAAHRGEGEVDQEQDTRNMRKAGTAVSARSQLRPRKESKDRQVQKNRKESDKPAAAQENEDYGFFDPLPAPAAADEGYGFFDDTPDTAAQQ